MHALAVVNTPIRDWEVYQTHSEYRMLMVEGILVETYLMMLLALDHRLLGQMMMKVGRYFIIVFFNLKYIKIQYNYNTIYY